MPASGGLSKVQIALIAAVVVGALAGAAVYAPRFLAARAQARLVAKIGDHAVTAEQLALRQAHANVYYPGSGTPEVALAQLIQGYVAAELMKRQGVTLDRATWLAEEERIDKQTRDPATLAKVKYVYGQDHENYLYVGILPDFAQSRLYKLYRSSASFSDAARAAASAFLDEAERNPDRFAALAAARGAPVRRMRADPAKGMVSAEALAADGKEEPALRDASPKSAEELRLRAELAAGAGERDLAAARTLLERLAGLAEGAVYPNSLETPEAYETVRLVRREPGGAAVVELAAFAKPDFGSWFWREAASVPVYVASAPLREALVREVGWAKQLHFTDVP